MRLKIVNRYAPTERTYRLCRFLWERGTRGERGWYSAKFSVALRPSLFHFGTGYGEWFLTVLGVRMHYQRAYGGVIC